jgi:hypothetical protein
MHVNATFSVEIPELVTEIRNHAFFNCQCLRNIAFPANAVFGVLVQPEVAYFHTTPPRLTLLKVMAQGEPDEKLWRERNVCCF